MIYIYGDWTSARALARELHCNAGFSPPRNTTLLINYGNVPPAIGRVLNAELITNKLQQLQLFKQRGVLAPEVIVEGPGYAVRRTHHIEGRDIRLLTNQHFLVQWLDKVREYRVHVFLDEAFRLCRKVPNVNSGEIWNSTNTQWKYQLRTYPRGLKTLARQAVATLGHDFGAVDIIQGRDRRLYVLEVNSAPGIADNHNTLSAYAEKIRRYYDSM